VGEGCAERLLGRARLQPCRYDGSFPHAPQGTTAPIPKRSGGHPPSIQPENLVQVFGADVIVVAGEQYLCLQMEWIEGSSLLSTLASNNRGQLDALRITRGILHGLSRLHSCRILHRDLKPANILLDGATPKITDFGSVAVLPDGATTVPASRHSALYVPPEGWEARPYYSMASDIYQVGMVLYELVNGPLEYRLPHYVTPEVLRELRRGGRNYESLDDCDKSKQADRGIAKLCSKGRLLAHGRAPRAYFSGKLRRIVNAATSPDPSKRYASAAEFIARLNQVDVPNWREESSGFLAENWRGWDWTVALNGNRPSSGKRDQAPGSFARSPTEFSLPLQMGFRSLKSSSRGRVGAGAPCFVSGFFGLA
jgi:serine/threonine protein kinase